MSVRVLVGYDGSPAASAAISAAVELFPQAKAWVATLWTPPFADDVLRRRLWTGAAHIDEFVKAVEREGGREAEQIAAIGVTLARAAGWDAEPLVVQTLAGEGLQLAELAEQLDADLVLVGSRGLGGAQAVLGSVSDMLAHYATRPVLVVPHPLLTAEFAALASGLVLVGDDGTAGAQAALDTAARLFPTRNVLAVTVGDGDAPGTPPHGDGQPSRLQVPAHPGPRGRGVAGALVDAAADRGAAVLVVGSRGRSAVREILLGSVAVAALHHAHRPVLVAHAPGPAPA